MASFSGTKSFRFNAVTGTHGSQEIGLELSYFDPDAGEYKTVRSQLQKVEITGEDIVLKDDEPAAANPPPAEDKDQLIGQHTEISGAWASLVPLVSRPLFAGLLGGSGLLCCAGIGLMVARARRENPERIAEMELDAASRKAVEQLKRAEVAGDVARFFDAARHVLQLKLGALWKRPAVAIALADVKSRFEEGSPVVRFFEEADQLAYGRAAETPSFPKWRRMLDEALLSLTKGYQTK